MKITIAITGASGAIYAQTIIARLSENESVKQIHLIVSANAYGIIEQETSSKWLKSLNNKVTIIDNNNFYTPVASGSNCDDAMIIIPCSSGVMGRIAGGISDSLITRSADVILKERKKLIIVIRETPYNLIHIENMKTITLAGGVILPATPSFYREECNVESIVLSVVERVEQQIGLDNKSYKWKG